MAGEGVVFGVVKGVWSSLSSPVLEEVWSLWGVGEDKVKLESYLKMINDVLQDAERRQVKEMAVKNWLRKIKAAAQDAEDVLDEFRIEALRRKVENDCCGIPLEKVSNFINLPVFYIKIAYKMQKLRKNFEHIATERSHFQFTAGVVDSQPRISRARENPSNIASEVYGRDTEKSNLIDLLIKSENGEDLSVIPIVGMGGVGKTTLAQLVYNDKEVVTYFQLRMWVYVSENFDVRKLLKEILESATRNKADELSMAILQNRLQAQLSGKRYLLVLDDVWNDNANECGKLKDLLSTCGANGSKLLVTTRHDAVAKTMHAVLRPRLGILSNEESWNLFRERANPPPMCVAIGQEMVKRCDGLPLAIRTLGGLMSSKKTVSEWEAVRDSSNLWKPQDSDGEILPVLQLSYDHLTPSLKQCFAYCAVIPKGSSIFKDVLIKQWIALGFIHSDEENEPLEEKAEGYFNELLQRSLFQVDLIPEFSVAFNYVKREDYKMHDLIHDLVRFVGEKECFIVKASMGTVPKETRHLIVQDDKWAGEPENLEALKKCEKLRSMSIYRNGFFDINACLSLKCLRVLDLNHQEMIFYLPNSIDKLKHLRYLDISYTCITKLPQTICNLHSLQTLRIKGTKIRMFPKNMKRMISLRHIEFNDGYPFRILLPKGIGELTCLVTLSTFTVGEESGPGIEELKGLNQLRGNFCITRLNHVRNGECAREANLEVKKHLHSLTLSWDDGTAGNSEEVIENLEPHSRLKKLVVYSYMGMKFPNWMEKLTNLTDITLEMCNRCEHLPPLWQLHFLESLEIIGNGAIKYIVEFDGSDKVKCIFPRLKRLRLDVMLGLEGWSSQREDGDGDEQVILQGLHSLSINHCPKLTCIPWLRHVSSLASLRIFKVGCDMIEIPASQSLMELTFSDMPNLQSWSVQDDDDGQMIFSSLRDLKINDCPKLICLPQLLLPALKMLHMSRVSCEKIEFSTSHLLRSVSLDDMPNLQTLSLKASNDNEHVVLCPFIKFSVDGCPRMTRLHHLLASSMSLSISKSNEKLLEWVVANYTSLSKLSIKGLPEVKHLPEELGPNHTSLHTLEIIDCPKLISLSKQLENLLALNTLIIEGCNDLVLLDGLQEHVRNIRIDGVDPRQEERRR